MSNYERFGAAEANDSPTTLKDAAIAVGIIGVGLVTFSLLVAKEFYSARDRRS